MTQKSSKISSYILHFWILVLLCFFVVIQKDFTDSALNFLSDNIETSNDPKNNILENSEIELSDEESEYMHFVFIARTELKNFKINDIYYYIQNNFCIALEILSPPPEY